MTNEGESKFTQSLVAKVPDFPSTFGISESATMQITSFFSEKTKPLSSQALHFQFSNTIMT